MRDSKVDLAVCNAATKGMPFDIVGLADMARWYMTRCTGLEVQLKCAEDANDQLKAGADAEIKRLRERCEALDGQVKSAEVAAESVQVRLNEALVDIQDLTNNYNCKDTCKHYPACDYDISKCKGWEWRLADSPNGE